MALETFLRSREQAAQLIGMPPQNMQIIDKATEARVLPLGTIHYNGNEHRAFAAQSGGFDEEHPNFARGGTRWTDEPMSDDEAKGLVAELATEMRGKSDDPEGGRKGLIVGGARSKGYTRRDREAVMSRYATLMCDAGLAGPYGHVVSADVNTGSLSDAYALRYRDETGDPLWRASAAAKSVENGGLAVRPEATGLGVMKYLEEIMRQHGEDAALITIQGFGQVAAWAALNAGRAPDAEIRINGISDRDGMITTDDPNGIPITLDMVRRIGDNPDFAGDKMRALQAALAANGVRTEFTQDRDGILYLPTDYFIPAAGGNVIDLEVARNLGARRGVIEAANGPTTPDAHQYLVESGLVVAPDVDANKQGVQCSRDEWAINMGELDPTTVDVRKRIIDRSTESAQAVLRMAREHGTRDLRVAAAAVRLSALAGHVGVSV